MRWLATCRTSRPTTCSTPAGRPTSTSGSCGRTALDVAQPFLDDTRGRADDVVRRHRRLGRVALHVADRRPRRADRRGDDLDPSRAGPAAAASRRAVSRGLRRVGGGPAGVDPPLAAWAAGRREPRRLVSARDGRRPPPARQQRRLLGAGRGALRQRACAAHTVRRSSTASRSTWATRSSCASRAAACGSPSAGSRARGGHTDAPDARQDPAPVPDRRARGRGASSA